MTSGNIPTYSSLEPGHTYCASISAAHVHMHALYGYRYYCNARGARNPLLPVLGEYYTLTWKMVREEEHLYILALLSILSTPFFPLTLSPPPPPPPPHHPPHLFLLSVPPPISLPPLLFPPPRSFLTVLTPATWLTATPTPTPPSSATSHRWNSAHSEADTFEKRWESRLHNYCILELYFHCSNILV